ncbi:short chain dehydrogenase/reductase family oxidoreductase [Caballeronia hypogeia]|uniref:Short chain dehydrogenase/reductase family oxidoreductase n=1 Tax=Caballeronia hypogeia TaxID=1777140 RepID=A0A158CEQ1_9BURK|nr:SDR family NAD(P)-dependent oxidoreductase [Caballeronia hypogeia]SAK80848.1 short chain dehydrogenase/reductase family oxidoreductase [Caballeronia hypogeia]
MSPLPPSLPYRNALIIGAGPGISASLTRRLRAENIPVVIAARNVDKLAALVDETGAIALPVDATQASEVEALFNEADARIGAPEIVIYNASGRVRGPIVELDAAEVGNAIAVSALGAFHAVQQAARRMTSAGKGAILLTGATAGVKGFALSAPFAMGKFALRGLAQSAARELAPKGIHVAHFVIDGGVRADHRPEPADAPDSMLDPDAIAQTYMDVLRQHRSAWAWEIELRPWVEKF